MVMNEIEVTIGSWSKLDNGVICLNLKDNIRITDEHVFEAEEALDQLLDGERRSLLINTGIRNTFTNDASELSFQMQRNQRFKAIAVVAEERTSRFTAGIYFRLHPPVAPSGVFSNEKTAMEWLVSNYAPVQLSA